MTLNYGAVYVLDDHSSAVPLDHEFGSGSAVFTRDGNSSRFVSRVKAGMVGVTSHFRYRCSSTLLAAGSARYS